MNDALDVEDAEQRLSRLQTTLHKLNATSSSKPSAPNFSFLNKEAALEPPKELLLRVHAFLPAIQASNARLASQDPEKIDIEHIEDNTGQYIEMVRSIFFFLMRLSMILT
ncbi:hypothetical protein C0991_000377 [Blastosporella zonata]|nr:hypothetical protein C0991_000377 [Blastosporella zonata]